MGHQINYFLTPKDFEELEDRLRGRGDVQLVQYRSQTADPCIMSSMKDADLDGKPSLSGYLVRSEDLSEIVTKHVPAQEYWTVEVDPSPVVECDGCFFDGKVLRGGRVYYTDEFYGPGDGWVNKTVKSEAFRKWAKSIFRTVKKSLKPYGPFYYIGSDTEAWIKSSKGELGPGGFEIRAGA